MTRVLCIGDDAFFDKNTLQILNNEGYEVDITSDLNRALQKIYSDTISLVLCDVEILAASDFDLLKNLKSHHLESGYAPFIFVGALEQKHNVIRALSLRSGDFMPTPIDSDILLAQIQSKVMEMRYTKEQFSSERTRENYLSFFMLMNEIKESLQYFEEMSDVIGQETLGPVGAKEYADFARKMHTTSLGLISLINDTMKWGNASDSSSTTAVG